MDGCLEGGLLIVEHFYFAYDVMLFFVLLLVSLLVMYIPHALHHKSIYQTYCTWYLVIHVASFVSSSTFWVVVREVHPHFIC